MHATLASYDQDLVRWGLYLLDGGGGLFNTGNNHSSTHNIYTFVPDTSFAPSAPVAPSDPAETFEAQLMSLPPAEVHNNVSNDEAIAHVLQEEWTKLAAEEAGAQDAEGAVTHDNSKAAVLSQDWRGYPPASTGASREASYSPEASGRESEGQQTYGAGEGGGHQQSGLMSEFQSFGLGDEDTKMGPPKQSSGSGSGKTMGSNADYTSYQYGDDADNLTLALALSEDEHRYDEEVAKRLTKLDSIRHVPRTNADVMPTYDAASLDHARLDERLILYGLNERQIQGDGNCQFRALSDQLYRTPEHHKFVRKSIVTQLKGQGDVYSGYVPMGYDEYLKKMAKSGEWGDHVTLQAAADHYGVKIWLITSFKDTSFIEILPVKSLSQRVIYLSFWAEVHYNSIYPEGDMSASIEVAPKKRHWLLKSLF